jgi:hypothetical protein
MSKKHYEIVKELDPAEVKNVPEVHKKHYLKLGYKPYRMGDGRIKWLTDTEKAYTGTKTVLRSFHLKKTPTVSHKSSKHKRRRRNRFYAFISDNWFIFVMIGIAIIIYLFFVFNK